MTTQRMFTASIAFMTLVLSAASGLRAETLTANDIEGMFVELTDMDEAARDKTITRLCLLYDPRTQAGLADLLLANQGKTRSTMDIMLEAGEEEDGDKADALTLTKDVKERIVRTLCLVATDAVIAKLEKMVGLPQRETALYGIEILGYIGSERSLAVLKKIASNPRHPLRGAAILSMANSGARSLIPYLQDMFERERGAIRGAARQALHALGARAGVRGKKDVQQRLKNKRKVLCVGAPGSSAWLGWSPYRLPSIEFNKSIDPTAFAKALAESGMLYFGVNSGHAPGPAVTLFKNSRNREAISQFLRDGGVLFFDVGSLCRDAVEYLRGIGVTAPGRPMREQCEAI